MYCFYLSISSLFGIPLVHHFDGSLSSQNLRATDKHIIPLHPNRFHKRLSRNQPDLPPRAP